MLKEMEWRTINNILLELYAQTDLVTLEKKLMRVLRMLIPYTKGYLLLLEPDGNISEEDSCFLGHSEQESEQYLHRFYKKDYLKYLYELIQETTVYRDTDIIVDDLRRQTEFYQDFLKPADIPYGCGIIIMEPGRLRAVFNLYRSARLGDFTAKDMEILNVLKKHIENMLLRLMSPGKGTSFAERTELFSERFALTRRELEILRLLARGYSNQEIGKKLVISISTVKKHVYNLYSKMHVSSRAQLLNLLLRQDGTKVVERPTLAAV